MPNNLKEESKRVLADQDHLEAIKLKNNKIKNDIETMIYDFKGRIESETIVKVTTPEQRETLLTALNNANDWLEDEGSTAVLSISREKLRGLEKLVNPILLRVSEQINLPVAIKNCSQVLESSAKIMETISETREVTEKEINEVMKDVTSIQEWLSKEMAAHMKLKPHEDSSLTSVLIEKKCGRIYSQFEKFSKRRKKNAKKRTKKNRNNNQPRRN